jgi:hypothetical protein
MYGVQRDGHESIDMDQRVLAATSDGSLLIELNFHRNSLEIVDFC